MKRSEAKAEKRVSVADIAARANVSKATVSLVLNQKSKELSISEGTRLRVLEAARKMGYRPPVPRLYQRHVRGLLRYISLVVVSETANASHEFLAPAHYEIMRAAGSEGLLVHAHEGLHIEDVPGYCEKLLRRDTDGVIVSTFYNQRGPWIDQLLATGVPMVLFNRDFGPDLPCVVMEHRGHAYEQTEVLIAAGHRRIGALHVSHGPALERLEGYRECMRSVNAYDPALECACEFGIPDAQKSADKLLRGSPEISAVFCSSDILALGVLRAARSLGRDVPRDLSVVSLDGFEYSNFTEPPLCTVRYPRPQMGRVALDLLRNIAQGRVPSPTRVAVRGEAVAGGSVANRER